MTTSGGSRAHLARAQALLHHAVLARSSSGWVHGQVVDARGADVVVRTGADATATCRSASAIEIDPVTVLLLERCSFDARTPLAEIQAIHAAILSRLLGDDTAPRSQPTRNIGRLLDRLIDPEDVPTGDRVCSWTNPADSITHRFPLQHAVDIVFVHDSAARRISKAVRTSVGETFFSPPAQGDRVVQEQRGREPPAGSATSVPPMVAAGTPGRGKKRGAPLDSFYDSGSDEGDASAPGLTLGNPSDRHARIVAALADDPELLDHYLTVQSRHAETSKRHHVELADGLGEADKKASKFQFRPTSMQERIHRMTMASRTPGTSAHDFLDSLIAHPAVQFAPHPGTLMRLYDFQFGTRGLSIMHLQWLKQLDKIQWVLSSGVNMQNFSAGISAPAARSRPASKISSRRCRLYAVIVPRSPPQRRSSSHRPCCHLHSNSLAWMELWAPADLKYLVFWINGRLESFRSCAVRDVTDGGSTRLHVQDTLSQTHPEFQAIVQLITTRRVTEALHAAKESRSHGANSRYGPQDRSGGGHDSARGQRRCGEQGQRGTTRVPQKVIDMVPRQGGKSLCLRSLSSVGCNGARGNPAECFDSSRGHFVPASLPNIVRDFIQQQYGGIRSDVQHL